MQHTHKRSRKQARSPSGRFRTTTTTTTTRGAPSGDDSVQSHTLQAEKPGNSAGPPHQGGKDAVGTTTLQYSHLEATRDCTSSAQQSTSGTTLQHKLVPVVTTLSEEVLAQYQRFTVGDEPQGKLVPVIRRVTPDTLSRYQRIPETSEVDTTLMTAAELLASPAGREDDSLQDVFVPLSFSLQQIPVSWINMLHHSASNTSTPSPDKRAGSPWSGELRYPSGYSERFVLSRNKSRPSRSKHKNDGLQPIDDLLHTIEVILRQTTSKGNAPVPICIELESAWKQGERRLFEEKLEAANVLIASPLRITRPSSAMIHHFLEQLYDRAVSPYVDDLNRNKKSREGAYGEVQPSFISKILKQLVLNRHSVYLDLGCGVGNTVMQAALETGCEVHGIELEAYPHLVGAYHLQQFHIRSMLWGMRPGKVQLYNGDFLQSPTIDALLPDVDVVLVNNVMFGPETDTGIALYARLVQSLKKGARVVSLRPLAIAKLRKMGGDSISCLAFETQEFSYEKGSVSWTGKPGTYLVSTKL